MNWKDIKGVPKDGTKVWLAAEDEGIMVDRVGPMVWFADENNPPFQQELGIWMTPDKSLAWSVENPDGAPTHFAYFEH